MFGGLQKCLIMSEPMMYTLSKHLQRHRESKNLQESRAMTDRNPDKKSFLNRYGHILVALFLIMSILAVYWQVRTHEFTGFDDDLYITENYQVQSGLTLESVTWAFTAVHAGYWLPLTWLSHMVDCQLFGLDAGWHHLMSVLFHIVNAVLLFLVFRKMTGELWRSAFVAALFALHPLRVESVAWAAERKDVLSTLFWILTMWSYVRYIERRSLKMYVLALLFFALGLMAKPMLVTLPFVLLLLDYWPLGRLQPAQGGDAPRRVIYFRLFREKIPFFVITLIFCAATFLAQQKGGAVKSLVHFSIADRIANALVSYVLYLEKMFWPFNLAIFYPHPGRIPLWQVAGACLALVLVSIFAVRSLRRHPYFAMGWLWYLGTLVPVIGLVQAGSQAMADRFTYVPHIGIYVIVAWIIPELAARWSFARRAVPAMAAGLLVALTLITWSELRHWKTNITVFQHAVDSTAGNWLAHNHLGLAFAAEGKYDEAMRHYAEAARVKSDYINPHINTGIVLVAQGKIEEAIEHYEKVIEMRPDSADAHTNLGAILAGQGRREEAARHYSEALKANPDYVNAHYNLGLVMAAQGRFDEALKHYSDALDVVTGSSSMVADVRFTSSIHGNMGFVLSQQGRLDEAREHYFEALEINPDNADAHNNIGIIFTNQARFDEAIKHYSEAVRINPGAADARTNMGVVYAAQGKHDEAIAQYAEALKIDPNYTLAHNNLGIALAGQGKYEEAIGHYAEVLRLNPEYANAHYNMGVAFGRQGKYGEAATHYSEALKLNPNIAGAHFNLGNILAMSGKIEEASAHFREALRLEPRNPTFQNTYIAVLNNLASTFVAGGEYDKAISTYTKLIELHPSDYTAYYNIARICSIQNKKEESLIWLKKAVETGFADWDFLKNDEHMKNIRGTSYYKEHILDVEPN